MLEYNEAKLKKGLITKDTKVIGCARLGCQDQIIIFDTIENIKKVDFKNAPFCLIIPGDMHFMEEEYVEQFTYT